MGKLTVYDEGEVLPVHLTRSCIDYASVDASITVTQTTIAGNLEHGSTVGVVTLPDVSVTVSHFCSIHEEPVNLGVIRVAGGAVDVDVSLKRESCLFVQTISIDTKSYDDWIKFCK